MFPGRIPYENGDQDWDDILTSQSMERLPQSLESWERHRTDSFLQLSGEINLECALITKSWSAEWRTRHFCCTSI